MKTYAKGSYKIFRGEYLRNEVEKIYQEDLNEGNTQTRESRDKSADKFVKTKASNMRDYADACFRYLRATGMVEISQKGHSLSIMPEKKAEVEFFLHTVNIAFYGGQSVIVPLELDVFINMVEQSYKADYVPDSEQIKELFEYSLEQAKSAQDENEWYARIKDKALNWL